MNDILLQVIIFFLLVLQGAVTRVSYFPLGILQKKISNKIFSATTDVTNALLGAAGMMLTCLLLANEVRIFYALFFIGGIAVAHFAMQQLAEKKSETKLKPATSENITTRDKRIAVSPLKH